ncbi:MAG: glycoside hydrolase family 16 protein [Clostridia bacterium]|nr:glycoside hydrolase family 16 protein [Clostridia bacterium]
MLKRLPNDTPFQLPETEWELTFSDDFACFDRTKWKCNTMLNPENPARNGIRNNAFYTDDEDIVFTKDGHLYIRTKWKQGSLGEGWYTAMLETSHVHPEYAAAGYRGFSQTGGYFEVRCKVPKAVGIWTAFWLMPDNEDAFSPRDVQWSGEDGLEVDVMESPHAYHLLPRAQNQNIHVLHADGYDERLKTLRSPAFYVPQMYTEFHTYGFLWETDKYAFFVDGHKTWETKHIYQGRDMGICRVPEYLLLSAEVAGCMENGKQYPGLTRNNRTGKLEKFWCGNPEKNDKTKPYDFVVDFVRCYRRRPK